MTRNRLVRRLGCLLLPILFAGTCSLFVPVGMRIADPMTHRPVDSFPDRPFPVVVMTGDVPRVQLLDEVDRVPALPAGSSFLIPRDRQGVIEEALNASLPPEAQGVWALRVRPLDGERQHIELWWIHDGYSGGGYEATPSAVRPRYRKITGPGFAFVFGGIALLLNVALWGVVYVAGRWISRAAGSRVH